MNKTVVFAIGACIMTLYLIFGSLTHAKSHSYNSTSEKEIYEKYAELENRLNDLEPPKPVTIHKSPQEKEWEGKYPSTTFPISEVLKTGSKIPFNTIKKDPSYERPVYQEQWHSTYGGGRWSSIPSRIYFAQHRLFPIYDIGLSGLFDFEHNIGIDFPTFQNKTDLDLYIVVFQTNVTEVYTKGNQVIVVGNPQRHGVQVITVKTKDIHPSDLKKMLLIQLATNGYELDYSLIGYEPPNYWAGREYLNKNKKWFKKPLFNDTPE
ncbi:hypothetical protein PU629_09305 [Pullulanibacillus sp. KACC 23026]|uniref:hypothetical protein n=1 Tax=Pullulanibacillus sp. KACC 23026 TaxID=3028315 RepID=UPI0023B1DBCE|nr:hypothetical protein [Pullulanibacillus sp. KACC 23026]WEG14533.1 hypothetical protein PU629_09305 [Pullulanibacillus sp. KACC 23026]